jgi:hypothetical protein
MKGKKIVGTVATMLVALVILSVSVLKSASIKYAFSPMVLSETVESESSKNVDYLLAYPGKIGPDNLLWYAKVIRDKAWYTLTFNKDKKTELNLLFADKRLNSSLELFKNNKPDLGYATLTKSEKYLEKAVPKDAEDGEYLRKLALASLKHRQVIETEILPLAPEDIRPGVIKAADYSKETYKKARDLMLSKGLIPPQDIFESK